jgi:photosystem II stability/assembly factor-like uncharacterized protein
LLIDGWGDLFHSTYQGTSFAHIDSVSQVGYIAIVPDTPRTIYLGGNYYGNCITKSSDGGRSWKQMNTGIPLYYGGPAPIFCLAIDPFDNHTVWATTQTTPTQATNGGGVLKTTDAGEHWTFMPIASAGLTVQGMIIKPDNSNLMLASGDITILKTTDGGTTWQMKLNSIAVTAFVSDPRNANVVYASTEGSGVIRSTDFGEIWEDYSTGIVYPVLYSLAISRDASPLLVAGSYGSGLYWVNPSNIVSGVAGKSTSSIPKELRLEQNYPNPFNPSTTIKYELPKSSHVTLTVYDLLGREVTTLVNEVKEPGTYTVQFDGSNLASGVYFSRLTAGSYVQTRKLLLLR